MLRRNFPGISIFVKTVLVLTSIIVGVCVVELYLQVSQYKHRPLLVDLQIPELLRQSPHDDVLIYSQLYFPNNPIQQSQSIPELQFRNDFRPNTERNNKTFTILMVGDSFTYGHKVNDLDTYPSKVEELLLTQGYDVNAYNAGVSGYSTDQEYLYVHNNIETIQPDLVVINLHENDIYDVNDNCLFKTESSGKLQQVTGKTSNIYIQSTIATHTPKLIKDSKALNLFLSTLSLNNQRVNYSCTKKIDKQAMTKKIDLLLHRLKEELQTKAELLLVLVPSEGYFDRSFSNDHFLLSDRRMLSSQLSTYKFIDSGSMIAQDLDPELVQFRDENISEYLISEGETADVLVSNIFHNDSTEPESKKGERHLNEVGNLLFAKYISNEITQRYNLPKQ